MPAAFIRISVFTADFGLTMGGPKPIWGVDLVLGNLTEVLDGTAEMWTAYQVARERSSKSGLPIYFDLPAEGASTLGLSTGSDGA